MELKCMTFSGIGPESAVLDVGGFGGNWAFDIHIQDGAKVGKIEPHATIGHKIRQRFQQNSDSVLNDFVLGRAKGSLNPSDDDDASSSFREAKGKGTVTDRTKPVLEFFADTVIRRIDLMQVNIQHGVYDLFSALGESHQCDLSCDFVWEQWPLNPQGSVQ